MLGNPETSRHRRLRTRSLAIAIAAATSVSFAVGAATAAPNASKPSPDRFSDRAAAQIAALQQVKKTLTPAERKLDSQLVVAERQQTDRTTSRAVPKLKTDLQMTGAGVLVDVRATAVTKDLLARLASVQARVVTQVPAYGAVRVTAPLGSLKTIAGWTDVRSVSRAAESISAHETDPRAKPPTKQQRAAQVEAQMKSALATAKARVADKGAPVDQGSVVSEGDKTEAADKARARFGVTGVGVKVCALSNGVDSLAASQATGDLPADVDVLPGQAGTGDEGTAMLEIIHDLAPNAKLGYATANDGLESFAQNIRDLRFVAGCDIIVDDVLYFAEDPFQDGPIAQSVNAVTADGALYFSSAGNEGNTLDGTSGNYEGDFVDSGQSVGKFAGKAHDFDPGPGVQVYEPLSDESLDVPVLLWWSDPLGGSANDYDVYEFDGQGNIVAFSQNVQNGTQDPFEIFGSAFVDDGRLAVVKFSGADRYVQLSALRGRYEDSADGLTAYVSPGVTRGHSAAVKAFSVAAAPAADPLPFDLETGDPPNPSGPYPNAFTKSQHPERFTSDGPRRVFYRANGTPITPGNVSSTGGVVRHKPDVTAADGVSTSLADFTPFFGTSAAAPHAAAIAALVLSGNPGASETLVRNAFNATALDIAPAGVDNRAGHGIIRADRVLANTGATPQPLVVPGTPSVSVTSGDGDAFLEPGETASVALPANNVGDGRATGVSVRLTSSDPLVTVTPTSRSYGSIPAGSSVTKSFTVSLASSYPNGKKVSLAAQVTFAGVLSPTSSTVLVPTGEPATTPTDFAYAGPPVPIPDDSPTTGASVSIPVTGIGYASGVTLSVDGTTCTTDEGATTVGIDHTYVGDLIGTLTNPSGATATLWSGSGSSGNNMCQVVFDDAATDPFSVVVAADAPFTGSYRPISPLSDLLNASADGSWTFTVADKAAADTGDLRAVSLHVTGFVS